MREDIEDIGDLFKDQLDDATMEPKSSNWDNIQKDLNKIQFRRFSIFRFNIYYASLIVVVLLFSSFYIFKEFSSEKEVQNKGNNATKQTDSIVSTDNKQIDNHNNSSGLSSDKSYKKHIAKPANGSTKNVTTPASDVSDTTHTTNTLKTTDPKIQEEKELLIETPKKPEPEKIKPKQERKQIYLTKQDTLVVIDTLDDAPARKRLKKDKTNDK